MKLKDMSYMYAEDAVRFRMRITALRQMAKAATTEEEARKIRQRIADLQVLVRQSRELAVLTRRYYERGYHKDEGYTL